MLLGEDGSALFVYPKPPVSDVRATLPQTSLTVVSTHVTNAHTFTWLMNSRRKISWFMTTRMVRAIAVLFLLYPATVITVPQCCSEGLGILSISEAAADSMNLSVVSPATDNSQKELPSQQPSPDEDCFCCSAHVVPGRALAAIADSDLTPSFTVQLKIDLPAPPLQSPYHPPRLA